MTVVNRTLYEQHIKPLTLIERRQLFELLRRELEIPSRESKRHSILELEGLGAEIWQGIDAQVYVDTLRNK